MRPEDVAARLKQGSTSSAISTGPAAAQQRPAPQASSLSAQLQAAGGAASPLDGSGGFSLAQMLQNAQSKVKAATPPAPAPAPAAPPAPSVSPLLAQLQQASTAAAAPKPATAHPIPSAPSAQSTNSVTGSNPLHKLLVTAGSQASMDSAAPSAPAAAAAALAAVSQRRQVREVAERLLRNDAFVDMIADALKAAGLMQ